MSDILQPSENPVEKLQSDMLSLSPAGYFFIGFNAEGMFCTLNENPKKLGILAQIQGTAELMAVGMQAVAMQKAQERKQQQSIIAGAAKQTIDKALMAGRFDKWNGR